MPLQVIACIAWSPLPANWPNAPGSTQPLLTSRARRVLPPPSHPLAGRDHRVTDHPSDSERTMLLTNHGPARFAVVVLASRVLPSIPFQPTPSPHTLPPTPLRATTSSPGSPARETGLTARKLGFRIPFSRSMAAIQGAQIHSQARRGPWGIHLVTTLSSRERTRKHPLDSGPARQRRASRKRRIADEQSQHSRAGFLTVFPMDYVERHSFLLCLSLSSSLQLS